MSQMSKLRFTDAFLSSNLELKRENLMSIISVQQSRLDDVEADLEMIRRRLEVQEDQRTTLEKEIAFTRGLSAPIRSLPFELLGMIFTEYADSGEALHALGLVCRRFHFALFNQPTAWRRIIYEPRRGKSSLDRVQRFLELSGASALDLTLDLRSLPYQGSGIAAPVVFAENFFAEVQFRRWRSFEMKIDWQLHCRSIEPFLLASSARDQPLLKSFRVTSGSYHQPSVIGFPGPQSRLVVDQLVSECTQLRSLHVPSRLLNRQNPVFKGLGDLSLGHYSGVGYEQSAEEIIRQCPELESLSIAASFVTHLFVQRKPFIMRRLKRVEIIGANFPQEIFRTMKSPLLETLVIENFGHGFKSIVEGIMRAFLAQKVPLKELHFRGVSCNPAFLLGVMKSLPSLVTLECTGSGKLRDNFLSALAEEPTTRRPWVCPRLENLHVDIGAPTPGVVRRLIAVRVQGADKWTPPATKFGRKKTCHHNLTAPVAWRKLLLNGVDVI